MYKTVLFDLDGTLMDTSEGLVCSIDDTIDFFNLTPLSMEIKKSFIGPPVIKSFKKTYNLTDEKSIEISNYFREIYKNKYLLKAKVYDGIFELLDLLRENNKKIAIATYKRDDYAKMLLSHFKIDKYCDFIQGADFENRLTKSDIVKICIDELKADTSNTVLIGDSISDFIGAKENNIDFIGVSYGFGIFDKNLKVINKNSVNELMECLVK